MFKVGQKVVCIKIGKWSTGFGPKKDETVLVTGECPCGCGYAIVLEGYSGYSYFNYNFRSIQNDFVEEVLEKAEKQHKEHELIKEQF